MIVAGVGVHAAAAIGSVDAVKLVLHDYLAVFLHQLLEFLLQLLPALGLLVRILKVGDLAAAPHRAHLAFLSPHTITHLFLRGNNLEILLVILGADCGCALEHHVLKEMGDAGNARALIGAAHARHPTAGD